MANSHSAQDNHSSSSSISVIHQPSTQLTPTLGHTFSVVDEHYEPGDLVPYNGIIGFAPGHIPAYSNGHDEFFSMERHIFHGLYMGFKWQCVEFARRWILLRKGLFFGSIPHAGLVFERLKRVKRISDGTEFTVLQRPNGFTQPPKPDSFILWPVSDDNPFGHIGVITEVFLDKGHGDETRTRHSSSGSGSGHAGQAQATRVPGQVGVARIAEQNKDSYRWKGEFARELPVVLREGLYYIEDLEDPVQGWLEFEGAEELEPVDLDLLEMDQLLECLGEENDTGKGRAKIERIVTDPPPYPPGNWLDEDDLAETVFAQHWGTSVLRQGDNQIPYYRASSNLLFDMASAANTLHRMFLRATERIMSSDELLLKCGIPRSLLPRVRHSWKTQRHMICTGRFDFAFDGHGIKVFEYNADSAGTLFECARIQQKWAETVGITEGMPSGRFIYDRLVDCWRSLKQPLLQHELDFLAGKPRSISPTIRPLLPTPVLSASSEKAQATPQPEPLIHLLIDSDTDEKCMALFMGTAMRQAGLRYKLLVGLDSLRYKGEHVVDEDDQPLRAIWKTWNWNSVFDQYEKLEEERAANPERPVRVDGQRPELSDLLLDDSILVFEPLWKAVPASKAILPKLWQMFPHHPLLLPSSFEKKVATSWLTDVKSNGYVSKPIRGRAGQLISLVASNGKVLEKSKGDVAPSARLEHEDMVFQALLPISEYPGGWYPTIGAWVVGDLFAGFGIREDRKLITQFESPFAACRILWD